VLTKDQLNEFISYFEVQDRLSRVFLSGVGIVCGFQLDFNAATSTITISQGTGVTTDGDLFKLQKNIPESKLKSFVLDKIEYTQYKIFDDKSAGYRFFKKLDDPADLTKFTPIELIEIFPSDTPNANPLSALSGLVDKVVLLYLEAYPKKGDLCTSIDCDNQGTEQVANLRVLLVSKTDAKFVEGLDSIYSKHDIIDSYFELPDVAVPRVILNTANTANYSELKIAYQKAMAGNRLTSNILNGIENIILNFQSILKLEISRETLRSLLSKFLSITKLKQYNLPLNIQYRYDFLKDIVDTYYEIKSLLLSLKEECCTDIKAFPKHILLGNLNEINEAIKHNRHSFYKSPILNCGSSKIKQCRSLVIRFFELIKDFNVPSGEIKITPSNKLVPLSFRSIPFYYEAQQNLLDTWNYLKTEKLEQNTNLSFQTSLLSSLPQIQTPLKYNLDTFDFYRIEGHQGMDYRKALELINQLKTENGLAFDLKILSVDVNSDNFDIDDYLCEFEDLYLLLRAWTAEQDCILAQVTSFFSAFSIVEPGINIKESEYNKARFSEAFKTKSSSKEAFIVRAESKASATNAGNENMAYSKGDIISESLTTDGNALGSIMQIAFTESATVSVDDYIAKAKYLVEDKVSTDAWVGNPDIKTFVIDQSIELMAIFQVLTLQRPKSISEMTNTGLSTYKLTIDRLCKLVKKLQSRYQTLSLTDDTKTFMGLLVNQLSSVCCSSKKLEILADEIDTRKERILLSLQLSKFSENNPGLEHLAGVIPGGTFILVYLNKTDSALKEEDITFEKEISKDVLTFFESKFDNVTSLKEAPISSNFEKYTNERISFSGKEVADIFGNLTDSGKSTSSVSIPKYTVIADFSLPYMCCSDCTPVNFIIQKPTVSLSLEKDKFCLGKDTSPLLFEVTPEDGIIKADTEIDGMTIVGKELSFDPATFPDEMLGKPIRFTVNGQLTQAQITVCRTIEFDFSVPDSPTTQTEITFIPTINLSGATFLWNFGDGTTSTERNPTHKFTPPEKEDITVIVSLTVSGPTGYCATTVEHEIVFTLPVNNCIEETKAEMILDLKFLAGLDLADSKIVHDTWLKTSEIYGGTANYKTGVLDDVDKYLAGNYNEKFGTLVIDLVKSTFQKIIELDPEKNKEEFVRMVKILGLQLKLFYNVLGCQDNTSIEKFSDILINIFNQIVDILRQMKKMEIVLPSTFAEFMKTYSEKVKSIKLLNEHLALLINENLI
jgi:hypothetical protein